MWPRFVGVLFALFSAVCIFFLNGCGSAPRLPAQSFDLTVQPPLAGAGTVTSAPPGINCPTTCSAIFAQGTQVVLTATPGSSYSFQGWNGACSGTGTCTIAMTSAESVTATFAGGSGGGMEFVYVSSTASDGTHGQIEAFAADTSGQLTALPGSPFAISLFGLAASGNFLFGTDGTVVYSYSVGSDGSIVQAASLDVRKYNNPQSCSGGPQSLFVDRTGSTLYDLDLLSDCANNSYQSISVDNTTGVLTYLGMTAAASPVFERGLSFLGNNEFGFGASCYHNLPEVYGFKRTADGTLTLVTDLGGSAQLPSGGMYCPWLAAADGANHLAVSMLPLDGNLQQSGPPQIAVYTVDDSGTATTNSTAASMPQIAGTAINEMTMSPSGTFLAVAESSGAQVFSFDGGNPVTPLTGLLTSDPVEEVRWDNANHLFAISNAAGKVYVFAVSSSGATQVSGSPYAVSAPVDIVVLPKQ